MKTKVSVGESQVTEVKINPVKFERVNFLIRGTAPYVSNNFSQEAFNQMKQDQEEGKQAKKKKILAPKDFQMKARGSMHISKEGWIGLPASAFRSAMIRACKLVGIEMTMAKLTVFIEHDGFDKDNGTPLIKFTKGEPHYCEHYVRLANGKPDIAARMMWDEGWEAIIRVRWDGDKFTVSSIANLLARVGEQVGIGAGRPFSTTSTGMGWGTFELVNQN